MQGNRQAQARDRQSIWSVPGHLWPWYIVIFVAQYFLFLGMTVWHEVVNRGSSGGIEITLEVQKGMTASILNMAASTYIILEGVMLAQWLRERDQRKRDEQIEKVREESIEAGRELGAEEANYSWNEWLERMQSARQEGVPFDGDLYTLPRGSLRILPQVWSRFADTAIDRGLEFMGTWKGIKQGE